MKLALIQPKQNQLYDFARPDRHFSAEESRQLTAEMTEQTFSLMDCVSSADLVVTTEAVNYPGSAESLPGPYAAYIQEAPLLDRFSAYAKDHACYVAACVYAHRENRLVNRAVVFDRQGRQIAVYDKIHLAGEEQTTLAAGSAYRIIDADFGRFGVCICWDMQFPEVCRYYALMDCRLVICPTWGWESIYANSRAYENGIWVAGAMSVPYRGGIEGIRTPSGVIAPDGRTWASASPSEAEALVCGIRLEDYSDLHSLRMHDRRPDTYAALCDEKKTW